MDANFVRDLVLEPADNDRLANLCGQFDEHLKQIERRLGVQIRPRGNRFEIQGPERAVNAADRLIVALFEQAATDSISPERVHVGLQEAGLYEEPGAAAPGEVRTRRGVVRGRGPNQNAYLQSMRDHDLCFGVGPAGTGKTYLAVASAVEALERDTVRRIVLVRPAVEAGERLGFLPGDMSQKIDPYLRPMYDALYEMLGFERVGKLIERHVIEIAPLAFMRGRTLNEAFVILDEAQNSTVEQMKMFLTRIGFGSRAVVNGDVTQTDLPAAKLSGLRHAIAVLENVEGVGFTWFTAKDVVRHPLVQRIVEAYERHEGRPER
ncbi:PhoH family protein [Wenzhouxiangella sp. XN24]|uniref:PhoH family protein n=1 Tax=Wenzhouxiangella sp. XN24 TaxID=2713569 RepID=UPI0013EAE58B|nr:PhoH family protein [Wenzhouxiangella sp. XN24]NGX14758.1 PhoH family protein [Wenzhouxiangella sp. XN24]